MRRRMNFFTHHQLILSIRCLELMRTDSDRHFLMAHLLLSFITLLEHGKVLVCT